jgi:hypothetical protein
MALYLSGICSGYSTLLLLLFPALLLLLLRMLFAPVVIIAVSSFFPSFDSSLFLGLFSLCSPLRLGTSAQTSQSTNNSSNNSSDDYNNYHCVSSIGPNYNCPSRLKRKKAKEKMKGTENVASLSRVDVVVEVEK